MGSPSLSSHRARPPPPHLVVVVSTLQGGGGVIGAVRAWCVLVSGGGGC